MHISIICKIKQVGKIERLQNKGESVSERKKIKEVCAKAKINKRFSEYTQNEVTGECS